MAQTAVALMESNEFFIVGSLWNATVAARLAHCLADKLTIVSFLADDSDTTHASDKFGANLGITDLTRREYGFHKPFFTINHHVELAAGPAPPLAS